MLDCRLCESTVYSLPAHPPSPQIKMFIKLVLSNIKTASICLCVISVHLVRDNLVQESMNLMQYW